MHHTPPSEHSDLVTSSLPWSPKNNRRVTFNAYGGPEVISVVTEPAVASPGKGMARIHQKPIGDQSRSSLPSVICVCDLQL